MSLSHSHVRELIQEYLDSPEFETLVARWEHDANVAIFEAVAPLSDSPVERFLIWTVAEKLAAIRARTQPLTQVEARDLLVMAKDSLRAYRDT